MTTRNSYAGDPVAGDVLTAANFKKLPGGWIAYDAVTTDQVTSGTTELTLHSLSVPVDASRKLKISHHVSEIETTVNADDFVFKVYYDGGMVGRFHWNPTDQAWDEGNDWAVVVDTTTAGNKTIAVTVQRTSGTGTLTCNNNIANSPAYMLVEDIGPSS